MSELPPRGGNNTSLAARVGAVVPLSGEEKRALEELTAAPPVAFRPRHRLLDADEALRAAHVLVAGWAMWHQDLPDGSRQIFDFILPGDIVGITAMAMDREYRRRGVQAAVRSPISVTALGWGSTVPVGRDAVDRLFERDPDLGVLLLAQTAIQRSAGLRRRLTNAGRRDARARLVDLLLELWHRLQAVNLADEQGFELPAPQTMLGELLGLTPVHISRTLTQLEHEGLMSLTERPPRRVVIHDRDALRDIASSTGRRAH